MDASRIVPKAKAHAAAIGIAAPKYARHPSGGATHRPQTHSAAPEWFFNAKILWMLASQNFDIKKPVKPKGLTGLWSMRRRRDSNPRYLAVRRFSRPVHSTTLPLLRRKSTPFIQLPKLSLTIFLIFSFFALVLFS